MKTSAKSKKALPVRTATRRSLSPELLATVTGGGAIWNAVPEDPSQDGVSWG